MENISEEDKTRAKNLIDTDDDIRKLLSEGNISNEEIILSVDYYELLSYINKKKETAIDSLKKISELR